MTPNEFQFTVLQYGKKEEPGPLADLVKQTLAENEEVALKGLGSLLPKVDDDLRRKLFGLMMSDGRAGLIPLLTLLRDGRDMPRAWHS